MDDDTLRARLERNFALLERFASTWQSFARGRAPQLNEFVAAREPLDISPLQFTRGDLNARPPA
jgi:hypothetical protein